MMIKEVNAKSILSASKIYHYVINPYVGCRFGCSYCYARYMKRFTGHTEPWGEFADIKVNAAELLLREINKKKKDQVWISGVCDPYQPLESKYELTRECLKILINHNWPIRIQTKSPSVLRDMDVIAQSNDCEVGLSITTADDEIRKLFEPEAPAIINRIKALNELHSSGIRTYAMIAPILPGSEMLMDLLEGKVDAIFVDRMNYHHADFIYKKYKLEEKLTDEYFRSIREEIWNKCRKMKIECRIFF